MIMSIDTDLDRDVEQQVGQRLAVAVEAEARIDAAFEHVIEDEIEGEQLRQLVAHDPARAAGGEMRGDAFRRNVLGDRRVERARRAPAR